MIFHITTEPEWKEAGEKGYYDTASLKNEGFIHCCLEEQVPGVLQRFFEGKQDLLRLEIETDKLTSPFYYEWSPSIADTFPHIYGVINLEAINDIQAIQ
ncbi:MAG: DUF952 domain-containing protein [Chitinophagaceae bacterium]|nr:DUF952 domain-containing protein [Chitinophagaceae bacterium]